MLAGGDFPGCPFPGKYNRCALDKLAACYPPSAAEPPHVLLCGRSCLPARAPGFGGRVALQGLDQRSVTSFFFYLVQVIFLVEIFDPALSGFIKIKPNRANTRSPRALCGKGFRPFWRHPLYLLPVN